VADHDEYNQKHDDYGNNNLEECNSEDCDYEDDRPGGGKYPSSNKCNKENI